MKAFSNDLPKVLIISSSTFSKTTNNGKTLSSFFYGYPKENIAQVSYTLGKGNPEVCTSYYVISISDVKNGRLGQDMSSYCCDLREEKKAPKQKSALERIFHYFSAKRYPFAVNKKNEVWKKADFSGTLTWIKNFDPDIVFFQGFSMEYGYWFALRVCEEFELPLILELTDDYTENLYKLSPIGRKCNKSYVEYLAKGISYADKTIVISPKMEEEYRKRFGGQIEVMMNSVFLSDVQDFEERDKNDYIYAGNVLLNRWKVLINFAKALKKSNEKAVLSIYTPDVPSDKILKQFKKQSNIVYGGSLSKEELEKRMKKCGSVVHVEAFDKLNKKITRLSLSTKISEYMNSGALICAIGPEDISSIEYLSKNNVALCMCKNDVDEMAKKLKELNDEETIKGYIARARALCEEEHDIVKNSNRIKEMIVEAVSKNRGQK